jgi:ubiquinone/menaquinone biosynthesis C-methylase UbiE
MDRDAFRRNSQAVWEAMSKGWDSRHAYLEEAARPVTELMIERLAPSKGERVLDLAAGTGVVGFAAAAIVGPEGSALISDFSAGMVASAERHAAALGLDNVECRVLDAERIDVPADEFDGVVCRWGYMLMADPAAALRETGRVLRPGGRAVGAVFGAPPANPWAALPAGVLRQLELLPPQPSGAPGIFALADPSELARLFTDAGFAEPAIEEVAFSLWFDDLDDYWGFLTDTAGAIAVLLEQLSAAERKRVRSLIGERLESFRTERGVDLPAVSLVASATAP